MGEIIIPMGASVPQDRVAREIGDLAEAFQKLLIERNARLDFALAATGQVLSSQLRASIEAGQLDIATAKKMLGAWFDLAMATVETPLAH